MNLETLTKLIELITQQTSNNSAQSNNTQHANNIDKYFLNKKVIIRTYSAGAHFGELIEKSGNEVILKNSRRIWYWVTANKGISLSEVAIDGLNSESKICSPIDLLWLEAIEIIPCTQEAIKSIESQKEYRV